MALLQVVRPAVPCRAKLCEVPRSGVGLLACLLRNLCFANPSGTWLCEDSHIASGGKQRWARSAQSLFVQPGAPAHEMVLLTFWVGLPSKVESFWKHPRRQHTHGAICQSSQTTQVPPLSLSSRGGSHFLGPHSQGWETP